MHDRVSLYPGRVKIEPVAGQAKLYDITRADQPTQEGTPLNKSTLLKDATAALFGLDATAVPDDALAVLSRFQNGLGNEYVWSKSRQNTTVNYGSPTTVKFTNSNEPNDWKQIQYSETIKTNEYGTVSLENPSTIMIGPLPHKNMPANHYFIYAGGVYYTANGSSQTSSGNICYDAKLVTGTIVKEISYLNSPAPNAYPPAVSDGYTYTALGQLGNKVRFETGSYVGTGTSGYSNQNSLEFGMYANLVFIFADNSVYNSKDFALFIRGADYGITVNTEGRTEGIAAPFCLYNIPTFTETGVSWYSNGSYNTQLNTNGITYNYLAI